MNIVCALFGHKADPRLTVYDSEEAIRIFRKTRRPDELPPASLKKWSLVCRCKRCHTLIESAEGIGYTETNEPIKVVR